MEAAFAQLIPFLLIAAVFYFLIIRPQRNRQQRQRALIESLGPGDRVVSIGGLHGTIKSVDEDTLRLDIATGTTITLAKAAVARRLVDADTGDLDGGPGV